ncbi:type II toxin-antitoxin system VapC family toxin [Pyrofollis japonicus]|uniref:PIN domain-containing protein n=1 Tax=Pyrofollis japonicus TaxID=3060460 RepID=UPI00295B498E|nr:PIN domain-containing protein [Pyrofollis japonicus]BEP17897.1 type II toxin-antitoxin system VapC family toxin [Pyrofollis japonicus]
MILVDTNAIVYYLHGVEPFASRVKQIVASREDLAVTLRIVDEVLFTLIRLEAWRRHRIKRLSELREYIRRHGIRSFYDVIDDVEELVDKLGIEVLEDKGDFTELLNAMRKFDLLPGDALIVTTAKHYNIDEILTFDEDFKRIPWLRVIQ